MNRCLNEWQEELSLLFHTFPFWGMGEAVPLHSRNMEQELSLSHPTCRASGIKEQASLSLPLHLNPDSGSLLGHVVGLSEPHFPGK